MTSVQFISGKARAKNGHFR